MTQALPQPGRPSEALLARLDDPQTAADLNRLLDRVGEMNALFDLMEGMLRRGPDLSNNVGRLVRETRERVPNIEADIPRLAQQGQRLSQALGTPEAERLLAVMEDPATLNAMSQLIAKMPDLLALSQMTDGFLQRGPAISNNVGRLLREFRSAQAGPEGIGNLTMHLKNLDVSAMNRGVTNLLTLANSAEVRNLAKSGIFGRETVNLVADVAEAARQASHQNAQPLPEQPHGALRGLATGVRGALALARDPAVRRTVAFAVAFAQNLGQTLARRAEQERQGR